MAKLKKSIHVKKTAAPKSSAAELQAKSEQISRSLVESAQQIWMAGVGALTRAQGEGSKLFEALVSEGMNIERNTRKLATGKVDAVRDAVEDKVGVVRERASDTWDRLEKVFEERVQRALNRLGVPSREDLADLVERVDALTTELKRSGKPSPTSAPAAKKAKPAAKKSAAPAKATPAKKAATRPVKTKPRKALPKIVKPTPPQA